WVQHLLQKTVMQPPISPEFSCLQYTFLSQIGHREDFRRRLATLYENWRSNMALGLSADMAERPPQRAVSSRAMATLVQAILHGLAMQRVADPHAFNGPEMLKLCRDVRGTFLWKQPHGRRNRKLPANNNIAAVNGTRNGRTRRTVVRSRGRKS